MRNVKAGQISHKLLIIFFSLLIALPLFFANREKDKISAAENRVLAPLPALYKGEGGLNKSFPYEFDDWINDNIGFREQAVQVNTVLQYRLFHHLAHQDFRIGENGEFFYMTDTILADYQGASRTSDQEMTEFADAWSSLKEELEKKEIQLLFAWIPNKETVYGDGCIPGVLRVADQIRYDQITDALKEDGRILFLPLKDVLTQANDSGQRVFGRYFDGSHWNFYGAHLSFFKIMEALHFCDSRVKIPAEAEYTRTEEVFAGIVNNVALETEEMSVYSKTAGYHSALMDDLSFLEDKNISWYYTNPDESLPRIVIAGDSYIYGFLLRDFAEYFSAVCFISNSDFRYLARVIEAVQPDIVMVEKVERMLGKVSDWTNELTAAAASIKAQSTDHIPLNGWTPHCPVDTFNGRLFSDENGIFLEEGERSMVLTGWAIDIRANLPASQVYCKINGHYYAALYGQERSDIAASDGNLRYVGYTIEIPAADIQAAEYLELLVIAHDGASAYDPVFINIRRE